MFELVVQGIDAIVLIKVNQKQRWQGVKMQRPWNTMFFGIGVWAALIGLGVTQTKTLPLNAHVFAMTGITPDTCKTILYPAGLRGSIIAWSDGIFGGLKQEYLGPAAGM